MVAAAATTAEAAAAAAHLQKGFRSLETFRSVGDPVRGRFGVRWIPENRGRSQAHAHQQRKGNQQYLGEVPRLYLNVLVVIILLRPGQSSIFHVSPPSSC